MHQLRVASPVRRTQITLRRCTCLRKATCFSRGKRALFQVTTTERLVSEARESLLSVAASRQIEWQRWAGPDKPRHLSLLIEGTVWGRVLKVAGMSDPATTAHATRLVVRGHIRLLGSVGRGMPPRTA